MAFSQPFVIRVYFGNETEVTEAQAQLAQSKVRSDYVKATREEPGRFKLVFTDDSLLNATRLVKKLTKVRGAQFFDPKTDWSKDFQPLEFSGETVA